MRDPQPILFVSVCCAALTAVLSSCSAGLPVQHDPRGAEEGVHATPYSVVCIVHGDGDYDYHDTGGNEFRADEELVASAIRVAERNPSAEVFIFHQKPRRRLLFLFPLHDGEFYYYRNGQLIANEPYWRDQGQRRFSGELEVYQRFHADRQGDKATVFLYSGHEIPEAGGTGYDASLPDRTFTVHDLADGLQDFTRHSAKFDLVVLSTCYNGTPYTIGTLGPFARHIIASPDNLHLSYFDLRSLSGWISAWGTGICRPLHGDSPAVHLNDSRKTSTQRSASRYTMWTACRDSCSLFTGTLTRRRPH